MANGRQLAEQNVETFKAWLVSKSDADFKAMANRGVLSRTEIAKECGFAKSALDQNPRIKAALIETENELRARGILPAKSATAAEGDAPLKGEVGADKSAREVVRLKRLEQENASLRAENGELKKQLARYTVIHEALAITGRVPR